MKGIIERVNDTTIFITELPIKKWTADYKAFLEGMITGDNKANTPPEIKDFKENHTDTTVSFTITAEKADIDKWEAEKGGLLSKFKLTGSLSTSNMNLFDTEQRITKYDSPEDILKSFFDLRLDYYVKRKELLVQKLKREQLILSNKARFVEEVCSGELVVSNRKKTVLLSDLQERGYDLFDKQSEGDAPGAEEAEDVSDSALSKGYEYLLGMKIWSLTYEKAEELRAQLAERTQELQELEAKSPNDLWLADLDAIEVALDERDIEIQEAHEDEKRAQKKNQKRTVNIKKKTAGAKKGSKKAKDWDSDSDDDVDMGSDSEVEVITKKTTVRRKPAAKPAAKPKATVTYVAPPAVSKKEPEKEVEEADDVELSLMERMKKKMIISPPAKKPTSKVADMAVDIPEPISFSEEEDKDSPLSSSGDFTDSSKGSRKRPSPKADDSDDEFGFGDSLASTSKSSKPAAKKAAAKKPAPKRAKPTTAAKKPAVKKTTVTKGKKKVEKPIDVDSSEDDFDMDSDSEDEVVVVKKTTGGTRARSARTQVSKKTTYVYSDADSDSDF